MTDFTTDFFARKKKQLQQMACREMHTRSVMLFIQGLQVWGICFFSLSVWSSSCCVQLSPPWRHFLFLYSFLWRVFLLSLSLVYSLVNFEFCFFTKLTSMFWIYLDSSGGVQSVPQCKLNLDTVYPAGCAEKHKTILYCQILIHPNRVIK